MTEETSFHRERLCCTLTDARAGRGKQDTGVTLVLKDASAR
jgi:hypothetical protein